MWKGKSLTRFTAGLCMVAAVAACGGGDEAPETTVGETGTPSAAPPTTAAPTTQTPMTDTTVAAGGAAAPATQQPAAAGGAAAGGDNAALVSQGQQAYASSVCVSCHGPNGQGTPLAPALNDGEWLWVDPAQGDVQTQVATIIKTGVSQPKDPAHVAPMLPYGGVPMDDGQVEAIAAYLVSLSQ